VGGARRPFRKRVRGGPWPVRSHPTAVRPALGLRPTPRLCCTRGTRPRPRRHPGGRSANTSPRPVAGLLSSTHNASPGIRRLPGDGLEPRHGRDALVGHVHAASALVPKRPARIWAAGLRTGIRGASRAAHPCSIGAPRNSRCTPSDRDVSAGGSPGPHAIRATRSRKNNPNPPSPSA